MMAKSDKCYTIASHSSALLVPSPEDAIIFDVPPERSAQREALAMQDLFQPEATEEVISRIDKLQPTTQRQWGKMDVAQMLAHCSATLDVASGRKVLPRMLIGRILGPFVRPIFTNDKPFSKNGATDKSFVIADKRDFAREQEGLKARVQGFHEGGESKCTRHPHSFFGPLTPQEWATGMYKHLDHHLRQFGV